MSNNWCSKNSFPLNIVISRKSTDVLDVFVVNFMFGWNWLIFLMKLSMFYFLGHMKMSSMYLTMKSGCSLVVARNF